MINFRPIFLVTGILLTILSIAMLIPVFFDIYSNNDSWLSFIVSSFLTAFFGIGLFLTNRGSISDINIRQAFIITTISWVILALFAALPFLFANIKITYTDAFFESMSGLTTTGATILSDLDKMPEGILIWRSLLQWMGGVGIIVMALAVLPMLKIGGMQLFRTESSDKSDKVLPRTAQISVAIGSVYLLLTLLCAFLLWHFGMHEFDAINHAMTTIATAGFSTHDASIGHYNSSSIEYVVTFFMIISALPFVLYVQMLRGNFISFFKDSQIRWFISILIFSIILLIYWLYEVKSYDLQSAIRYALFNVTSVITTTGFSSDDYSLWGGFAVTYLFLLSVVGGCTGSTTGGIKIFRYQMLYHTAKTQISHLIQPHAIFRTCFNGKAVPESVSSSVMSFIILFAFSFLVLAVFLSFLGLDYISSMSAAASTMANLGPGLGPILGPSGTYEAVPAIGKWVLSFAMLLGRLEIFTVLILFSPLFWRE